MRTLKLTHEEIAIIQMALGIAEAKDWLKKTYHLLSEKYKLCPLKEL